MALLGSAAALFFFLGSTTATIATEIFVDTSVEYDGGASAGGTQSSPFDSLERARDAMRSGLGRGTQRVVRVRAGPGGGPVYLARPFALTAEDSGTADAGITYAGWATAGAPPDAVHLQAGTPVPRSAWSSVAVPSGAPHVFVANLTSLGVNASSLGAMANPYVKAKRKGERGQHAVLCVLCVLYICLLRGNTGITRPLLVGTRNQSWSFSTAPTAERR